MRMPPGFEQDDCVLLLKKALYGLRESPLLWQRHFTASLQEDGFQSVPHEPCCWIKGGVIVFFYVDDIVVAYRREYEEAVLAAIESIRDKYSL